MSSNLKILSLSYDVSSLLSDVYQSASFSLKTSTFSLSICSGLHWGFISHPAFFNAEIYRGSLIPDSVSKLQLNNSFGFI